MTITYDHIKASLGNKYREDIDYRLCEKGPQLASKLAKGWGVAGKVNDELTAGSTEMFILVPPKSPAEKTGGKK